MARELDDYLDAASRFCDVLEAAASLGDAELRGALSQALAQLYAAAVVLPRVEPSGPSPLPASRETPLDAEAVPDEVRLYWTVDGLVKTAEDVPDPTIGDLYDDLAEVRRDVLAVLDSVNSAVETDLVWQARFDFETHWSWHALDALRALHPSR